ncbi:MAG: hypothetical protein WDN69_35690 [Aliidongia sp.]
MITAEPDEPFWTDVAVPTPDGINELCLSFSGRIAQMAFPDRLATKLCSALAEIGSVIAKPAGNATRLVAESGDTVRIGP